MNYIQSISKVRERGQLTVPLDVRKALNWPEDEVLVKIVTIQDGFRVEKLPVAHPQNSNKKLTVKQWDDIYKNMEAFSKTGKQDIKLTDFLRRDRDTHF